MVLFDARDGLLISADALWENGFGMVFPELDGVAASTRSRATLDLIESRGALRVIPGHGAPFTDVAGALHERGAGSTASSPTQRATPGTPPR